MVTGVIITAAFWFIVAAVTACIEIEAEGKFGWAEKMPTWYRNRLDCQALRHGHERQAADRLSHVHVRVSASDFPFRVLDGSRLDS